MGGTPLLARLGLWRLTRNPIARRVYNHLASAGMVLAQLDRFEREAAVAHGVAEPPDDVTLTVTPAVDSVPTSLRDAPLAPGDLLVRAERGGTSVGHCCLSDRPVYVPELRQRLTFEGSYLWGLYVAPAERGRGIGTAIVARAVTATAASLAADRIVALVAPDNLPSRKAFARLGFRPNKRYTSYGLFGRERHRCRPLDPKYK
jgi:ribosomal protein S18 acetylase RimI-like enzyme